MSKACVFGNGESRTDIDIDSIPQEFTKIGCNAIHRHHKVDHLITCDRRMIEEAIASKNTRDTAIHVRDDNFKWYRKGKKDKRIFQLPNLPYSGNLKQDNPQHWGSGPYAILLAAELGSSDIYLLGFDLYPNLQGKINNLYKGTPNYKPSDYQGVDYSFWVYQISKIFKNYPQKNFFIVNKPDWVLPSQWKLPNTKMVFIENFFLDIK